HDLGVFVEIGARVRLGRLERHGLGYEPRLMAREVARDAEVGGSPRDVERSDSCLLLELLEAVANLLEPVVAVRIREGHLQSSHLGQTLRQVVVVQNRYLRNLPKPLCPEAENPREGA